MEHGIRNLIGAGWCWTWLAGCARWWRSELGSPAGRRNTGDGAGGDITFAVDAVAENALAEFLAERAPRVGYYSEDRGLVADDDAVEVLVVDPIDGTRPAMAGLESACVAVAMAPLGDGEPTMADVHTACVVEIKSGDWFVAVRGHGLVGLHLAEDVAQPQPGTCDGCLCKSYGFRGRPVRPTVEVLGDLHRRLLGWRRHLRAGFPGVCHDSGGHRPARRGGRGRLAPD